MHVWILNSWKILVFWCEQVNGYLMVTESMIETDPELLKRSLSFGPEDPLFIDVICSPFRARGVTDVWALGALLPLLPGEGFSWLTSALHRSNEVEESGCSSKSSATFQALARQIHQYITTGSRSQHLLKRLDFLTKIISHLEKEYSI